MQNVWKSLLFYDVLSYGIDHPTGLFFKNLVRQMPLLSRCSYEPGPNHSLDHPMHAIRTELLSASQLGDIGCIIPGGKGYGFGNV